MKGVMWECDLECDIAPPKLNYLSYRLIMTTVWGKATHAMWACINEGKYEIAIGYEVENSWDEFIVSVHNLIKFVIYQRFGTRQIKLGK